MHKSREGGTVNDWDKSQGSWRIFWDSKNKSALKTKNIKKIKIWTFGQALWVYLSGKGYKTAAIGSSHKGWKDKIAL